jgi:predicted nuclease of predicted toxin-antitoxin system
VKLIADLHISPRTVEHLRGLGHDVVRVIDVLPATASDAAILEHAAQTGRCVLTQDLDFSGLIAVTGKPRPSLVCLRLSSSRIEHVNEILERLLPAWENALLEGCILTVEDRRVRCRRLPIPE